MHILSEDTSGFLLLAVYGELVTNRSPMSPLEDTSSFDGAAAFPAEGCVPQFSLSGWVYRGDKVEGSCVLNVVLRRGMFELRSLSKRRHYSGGGDRAGVAGSGI